MQSLCAVNQLNSCKWELFPISFSIYSNSPNPINSIDFLILSTGTSTNAAITSVHVTHSANARIWWKGRTCRWIFGSHHRRRKRRFGIVMGVAWRIDDSLAWMKITIKKPKAPFWNKCKTQLTHWNAKEEKKTQKMWMKPNYIGFNKYI